MAYSSCHNVFVKIKKKNDDRKRHINESHLYILCCSHKFHVKTFSILGIHKKNPTKLHAEHPALFQPIIFFSFMAIFTKLFCLQKYINLTNIFHASIFMSIRSQNTLLKLKLLEFHISKDFIWKFHAALNMAYICSKVNIKIPQCSSFCRLQKQNMFNILLTLEEKSIFIIKNKQIF